MTISFIITYKSYAKSGEKKSCIIIIIAFKVLNIHIHEINIEYLFFVLSVNTVKLQVYIQAACRYP